METWGEMEVWITKELCRGKRVEVIKVNGLVHGELI